MIDDDETPSPTQLADHPELAVLAALDHTMLIAEHALLAAHPLLCAGHETLHDDARGWVAETILAQLRALSDVLATYRHAVRVDDLRLSQRLAANV